MSSKTKIIIRHEWNGRTIYISDDALDEIEDTYLESQLKFRKAGSRRTAISTSYSSSSVLKYSLRRTPGKSRLGCLRLEASKEIDTRRTRLTLYLNLSQTAMWAVPLPTML